MLNLNFNESNTKNIRGQTDIASFVCLLVLTFYKFVPFHSYQWHK